MIAIFTKYDADKSGRIEIPELLMALEEMEFKMEGAELLVLLQAIDKDKSGDFDVDEFGQIVHWAVFDRYDTDGSGKMNLTELQSALNDAGYPMDEAQAQEFAQVLTELQTSMRLRFVVGTGTPWRT